MPETHADLAFWSLPEAELLSRLNSSEQGLSQADAAERLSRTRQLKAHKRSPWRLLLDQFKNPIILLLFGSALLSFSMPVLLSLPSPARPGGSQP